MLTFTTSEAAGVLIVEFEATQDEGLDWQFTRRDWLYQAIESRDDGRFALDLSDVDYLASSEIGFLVTLKRRIDRCRGRLVVFGVAPYVLHIFRTMNLQKLLDVVDSRNAALAQLRA